MVTESDPTLAETAEKLHEFADRLEKASHPINTQTVSTVLNLGGAGLILGILIGTMGMAFAYGMYVRADARELAMATERKADLRELSALMSRVEGVESQVRADRILITKAEQRITQLEPRP